MISKTLRIVRIEVVLIKLYNNRLAIYGQMQIFWGSDLSAIASARELYPRIKLSRKQSESDLNQGQGLSPI